MSELSEYGSPPRGWQARDIAESPAQFDFEPQTPPYPEYDFLINPSRYVQDPDKVLELTPEARLRYTVTMIAETCGPPFLIYAHPAYRKKQVEASQRFIHDRVSIGGHPTPRRDLIDPELAHLILLDRFAQDNHPAFQVLNQVKDLETENGFSHSEVKKLFVDVLAVYGWQELKKLFEGQLKARRETA